MPVTGPLHPDTCLSVIKASPTLLLGTPFPTDAFARAICRAVQYHSEPNIPQAIAKSRASIWPEISKAVQGGLVHVISADNAAGYAELWHKGGSWYAVTGAKPKDPTPTLAKADPWHIYEIPGVTKNMPIEQATARFLGALFGASLRLGAGGCGCAAAAQQTVEA